MSPTKSTKKRAAPPPATSPQWTPDMHGIDVVSYNVADFERAKKFYGETLGLPIAAQMDGVGWIEYGFPNHTHLALNAWQGPGPVPTGGGATVVFGSKNVRAAVEHLRAKGVRCDDAVEIPGMVIYASFYDLDGNRLQIAESPSPSA